MPPYSLSSGSSSFQEPERRVFQALASKPGLAQAPFVAMTPSGSAQKLQVSNGMASGAPVRRRLAWRHRRVVPTGPIFQFLSPPDRYGIGDGARPFDGKDARGILVELDGRNVNPAAGPCLELNRVPAEHVDHGVRGSLGFEGQVGGNLEVRLLVGVNGDQPVLKTILGGRLPDPYFV